jgi:hypothetical protein
VIEAELSAAIIMIGFSVYVVVFLISGFNKKKHKKETTKKRSANNK